MKGMMKFCILLGILLLLCFGCCSELSRRGLWKVKPLKQAKNSPTSNNHAPSILQSGASGAIAGAVQVVTLMWLRTTTNVQYRYGLTFSQAMSRIYSEGGLPRFYHGLAFALLQGPLARFGAVASNEFSKKFSSWFSNRTVGAIASTLLGAILAAFSRVALMPLDTCKTILQVNGFKGFHILIEKVITDGEWTSLFEGTMATMICTLVAHYPWFLMVNVLDMLWTTKYSSNMMLLRSAMVGFIASAVSDLVSNPIRVIKTIKQTLATGNSGAMSYSDIFHEVIIQDGFSGLFFRGLESRILSNGLQSMLFTVIWKYLAASRAVNKVKVDNDLKRGIYTV